MATSHSNIENISTPYFSVLIGRVSTEDSDRILETLESLRKQTQNPGYEVIIADRLLDEVTARIKQDYPETRIIEAEKNSSLPVLRTRALESAQGKFIIVTEDHCVPSENWLHAFVEAIDSADDNIAAFGGCVENGVTESSLDWATFLCEYSFFQSPVAQGDTDTLPGMNVAYRANLLRQIDLTALESGFWETTVHPLLLVSGYRFHSSNRIKLYHKKKFSLSLFLKQRFIYSQYYAGLRFAPEEKLYRAGAFLASGLLPPILLYRIIRNFRRKNRLNRNALTALPYLMLFTLMWATGEMWGYLMGPQNSLTEIE